MSILDRVQGDDDTAELKLGSVASQSGAPRVQDDAPVVEEETGDDRPPVKPVAAAGAALLSASAVGWMLGGAFAGMMPRIIGIIGAVIGASVIALASKLRNPLPLQLFALPAGVLAGIALLVPSTSDGSIPQLIQDAIKAGGLSQPPAPFDPGWRFLLVVLTCALATVASTTAIAANRLRLAVFLPAPIVGVGVLIQPEGKELLSIAPSLVMLIAGLAIAFGGELSRDTETGAKFEARRLVKAGGMLALIVGAMVGLSQMGFLYPPTPDSTVVPPKRPQTPPVINGDPVLYTVKLAKPLPLRLGVLDTYDGIAWLTPPYDPKRYLELGDGPVPAFAADRSAGFDKPQTAPKTTVKAELTIAKVGPAREIPDLNNTVTVAGLPKGSQYDPRTQTVRLPGRATSGQSYTVTAAEPPSGAALQAGKVSKTIAPEFLSVPPAPPAVEELLKSAPKSPAYERLQYVRTKYYSKVTAAGPGNPVDLPPSRVQEFLTGVPATPYEITASEVLLARWAGIPARIGYGYYNDTAKPDAKGFAEIHASDGAMWLEVNFDNTGWTPILGKPPKAQSSLDDAKKKNDKSVLPNGLITAQLYIPIRQQGLSLLYTIVQFWLARAGIVAGIGIFFWIILPGLIKSFRRGRRRRWADKFGPREQIAVSYADFRDRAIDFNVGHPTQTPLEFLDSVETDEEHRQLAWLVTRALWGDLRRDLRQQDVELAENLARSMSKRLTVGQPFLTRVVAYGSRVSLREPWDETLPNPYWKRNPIARVTGAIRGGGRAVRKTIKKLRRTGFKPRALLGMSRASVLLIALLMTMTGCVKQLSLSSSAHGVAPLPSVPAEVSNYTFERTPVGDSQFGKYRDISLIQDYGFYVVRDDKVAVATLQTATFKAGLKAANRKVREGVLNSLGGTPKVTKVGAESFYRVIVNDLTLIVWFPADGLTYQLLAATKKVTEPADLMARLVAVQQGKSPDSVNTQQGRPPADGRRQAP